MSMVSPLHPLFHAESCQADIQTLRWKERPRPCRRCQRLNVGPWGTDHHQPGLKRDRCQETGCQRTVHDLTGTLLEGSKRSLAPWLLAPLLLCLSCAAGRMAKALGVHGRTGYRWGGGWRQGALSSEIGRQVDGTVEADALYHSAGHQGQAKTGGAKALGRQPRGRRHKREPGRGYDDQDRPALMAWVSRQGGGASRRHGTLPSRRCNRRPILPCKPAGSSTRTRLAATG